MTVRRATDTLGLSYDQRMGTPERRVRRRLHVLGFRLAPSKPGTKKRAWSGNHTSPRLLGGDCLIYLPAGYVLIDPDSSLAQELLEHLELPRTLALGGSRGVRLLYRLPKGVVLRQEPKFLTDLDIIVEWFVAPGSEVDGHYYRVVDECEIAEMPRHIAEGIAQLQRQERAAHQLASEARPTGTLTFVVEDAKAWVAQQAADNRRQQALQARRRTPADLHQAGRRPARTAAADRRSDEELLAIDRDGERHPAMGALAARGLLRGETCEAVEQRIGQHPLGSKLEGKPGHWFRQCVWEPTEQWLADQGRLQATERPACLGELGPRWVRRWRRHVAVRRVRQWQAEVERVLRHDPDDELRQSYLALCALHADYATRYAAFGVLEGIDALPCYFLAFSVMRDHLGGVGGDVVTRRLERLITLGLLIKLDRGGLVRGQATYYQLAIDGRPILPPPPPCSDGLSWPVTCGFARRGCGSGCFRRAGHAEAHSATESAGDLAHPAVPVGARSVPGAPQPP